MKSYKALVLFSIFALLFSLSSLSVRAQADLPAVGEYPEIIVDQVDVQVVPKIPAAYDRVSINLADYTTDLNRAQISWTVNGKTIQAGIGIKSFLFSVGGIGETTKVTFRIQPPNGPFIEGSVSLTPEGLDLVWEANSYTAPFYKGKAMYPPEGELNFVALPTFFTSNGTALNPTTLVYKWTKDGTVLGDRSGYGRNILAFTGSLISKPTTIMVEVSTLSGSLQAKKIITVEPQFPSAIMYENNPLYGILFNKAITSNFTLTSKEGKFEAFPFFFSGKSRSDPSIQYSWKLNDLPLAVVKSQHSMVFRNENNDSGTAVASVGISNLVKLLQVAQAQLSITYGPTNAAANFFNGQ